ncbi:hypothetical protein OPW13_12450 [Vibrio europaeus]|uniref:Uncharacterized protein n=1 Tax=Vibrio europaeus TaxID=300876 RepID=A0A178JA64_9VIBR|nr:hypothetical protein [Vibrio europaeus]MDC5704668.1 hypothetical protein [Vibrio europaeus]MDC5711582.1 hypothetical protein [Vibrio europaeus]MDC5713497.1 hypothetical protein [Vibrio europaeus]MDC5843396.1 hypothetical protein [Vibrio europaeus]MDC5860041.1 hypothetical protein [Vibrio europaeus]
MTDKTKTSTPKAGLSIGGVSSALIFAANHYFEKDAAEIATVAIPLIVGLLFIVFEYCFTIFGMPNLDEMRLTNPFDRSIKFTEKRIKKARKAGRNPTDIQKLEQELLELELARSKAIQLANANTSKDQDGNK